MDKMTTNKKVTKRTLAGPKRAAGQFEPDTKIGSGESLGAQTGKGNYSGQKAFGPEPEYDFETGGIIPRKTTPPKVDDLDIDPDNVTETPEAKPEKSDPRSVEDTNRRAAEAEQDAAYRQLLSACMRSPEEVDAVIAKLRANYGNNGIDRIAVFQGTPEKLRDSSGEIVEIPCAGGDMQRVRASLQKQVEDAEAAVEMATTTTAKKKAKVALQTAQRLRNAMEGETDGDKLKREIKRLLNYAVGKGWIPDGSYSTQDVEDMFAEATLWELGKRSLEEGMEKNALPQTPETVEQLEALASEEMKHSEEMKTVCSSFGARYAILKWQRENRKRFYDEFLFTDERFDGPEQITDGAQEAYQKTQEPDRTPVQYYMKMEELRDRVLRVITPEDYDRLAQYVATKGERHSSKERKWAQRMRKRLKDAGIG